MGDRWLRVLAIVLIGSVITSAFQATPGPGLHGRPLGVSAALVGLALGTFAANRLAGAPVSRQMAAMVLAVVCAGGLVGLQPNGPGFLGVFPVLCGAAIRLPELQSGLVAVITGAALAVGWAVNGHHPVSGVLLNEFGVAAVYLLGTFARRLHEANQQSQELISELEQTRRAQAAAAVLGERQRLAREMHDVLAHSLSGLLLNLEGARLLADRDNAAPEVMDAIQRAQRLAKTGLDEARRAIGMLRDDELPGPHGLATLAADFENDGGAPCRFEICGNEYELGSDRQLTLYRVAQEALTNIRKHARPDRVEMHLAYETTGVRLTVEDVRCDGERPAPGDGSGYGLTGMRERAALLGGTLTAGPTMTGFRVELWVPA